MKHRTGGCHKSQRANRSARRARALTIPLYRIAVVRSRTVSVSSRQRAIGGSADAKKLLGPLFHALDRECFYVVALDQQHKIIGASLVSVGSLSMAIVHPREVFKPAITLNAAAVIVAHNHPSGNPKPSHEDTALTRRLWAAGRVLGIQVLDHLIFGDRRCLSFADRGLMPSR